MFKQRNFTILSTKWAHFKFDAWGSPICERVRKKNVEYFKNNVPQRQIANLIIYSA